MGAFVSEKASESQFPTWPCACGPEQRFRAPEHKKVPGILRLVVGARAPYPPYVTVPTGQSWPGLQSRHHHLFPALELLKNAIGKAGYSDKVVIGMDVAASEFYRSGKYDLDFKSPDDPSRYITPDELANLYKSFIRDYPGECSQGICGCEWRVAPPRWRHGVSACVTVTTAS